MTKVAKKLSEDRLDRVERILAESATAFDERLRKEAAERAAERKKEATERAAERKKEAAERAAERKKEAAERAAARKNEAAERAAEREKEEAAREKAAAARKKEAAERAENFRLLDKKLAEIAKRQEKTDKQIGGFTQTVGEALEEEFADALDESKRIGDIKVDKVLRNIGTMYEFDAACINGDLVVVVEIKHKLSAKDVKKFADERLPHFAADCPLATGKRKVFGAVGGGGITKKAKEEAKTHGLYVLRLRNRQLIVDSDRVRAV